jgi:hypothetical protein
VQPTTTSRPALDGGPETGVERKEPIVPPLPPLPAMTFSTARNDRITRRLRALQQQIANAQIEKRLLGVHLSALDLQIQNLMEAELALRRGLDAEPRGEDLGARTTSRR